MTNWRITLVRLSLRKTIYTRRSATLPNNSAKIRKGSDPNGSDWKQEFSIDIGKGDITTSDNKPYCISRELISIVASESEYFDLIY